MLLSVAGSDAGRQKAVEADIHIQSRQGRPEPRTDLWKPITPAIIYEGGERGQMISEKVD